MTTPSASWVTGQSRSRPWPALFQLRKLSHSISRPMCIAVFGESQPGKSYLVSSLAGSRRYPKADLSGCSLGQTLIVTADRVESMKVLRGARDSAAGVRPSSRPNHKPAAPKLL